MTSGQGDHQPGGQHGPPQGWNAPPPPPGQYPGFSPAPPPPTGFGAPQQMERPTTVRAGIGAFVASLLIGLISSVLTFADLDALIAQAQVINDDPALTEDVIRAGLVIGAVVGLVILAVQVLFIWFAWKGANWARIVLWVLGGISVLFGFVGLSADTGQTGSIEFLGWCQLLLTAAGIVLLALAPSNVWYRFRSQQRANGLG